MPALGSFWGAVAAGAAGGFAAGFSGTLLHGGSIGQAFSNGLIGGISGAAFGAIGGMDWTRMTKIVAHGLTGGAVQELQGGKFAQGFAAAGFAQAFAPAINGLKDSYHRLIAAAAVGGTASELSGGSFENGAVTAAFSRMFNDELHGDSSDGLATWADSLSNSERETLVLGYDPSKPVYNIGDNGSLAILPELVSPSPLAKLKWVQNIFRFGKRLVGNPFRGKSPQQIDKMFRNKGFEPRGRNPSAGEGGFVNPNTGRSFHIDPKNKFGEASHVDVNRPRGFKGLDKKKYFLEE